MKRDGKAVSRGHGSVGFGFRKGGIGRVDEEAHDIGLWHEFVQQFQPLRRDECVELRDTRDVLAWLVEISNEPELDRIETGLKKIGMVVFPGFPGGPAGVPG